MPTDQNPKQLVTQRLRDANNILVTVSRDPGVDELSAALALTLILDKLGKTPTAVFSGKIPPAIEFLEPGKLFDTNVDGLRDFIIALDKEKADRLRYKVEGDVVRVFITPYKTTITEKDLTFSQGDFNVDLIVAFGVAKREDLDTAITAHGRILHDAAVITVNQFTTGSSLGEIDWNEPEASSLCEMLMSISESLQSGLLDKPIATALLTGLVSATDRFRNEKTSPKVMTMAAQLMAAGADQHLIADKLEEADTVSTGKLNEGEKPRGSQPAEEPKKAVDGEMKVEHGAAEEEPPKDAADRKAREVAAKESAEAVEEAQEELDKIVNTQLPPVKTQPEPEPEPKLEVKPESAEPQPQPEPKVSSWRDAPVSPPSVPTPPTEEKRPEVRPTGHVILSHDSPILSQNDQIPVLNATALPPSEPTVNDIFSDSPGEITGLTLDSTPEPAPEIPPTPPVAPEPPVAPPVQPPVLQFEETPLPVSQPVVQQNPTLADLEAQVLQQETAAAPAPDPLESARAAVDAALGTQPFNPAGQPVASLGAQPLGDITHTETPSQPTVEAAPQMTVAPPPLPPLPPLPDFSTLPPLPGDTTQPATPAVPNFGLPEATQIDTPIIPAATPSSSDPGQFKLPGQ